MHGSVKVIRGRRETLHSTVRACPGCARSFDPPDPRLFSYNSKHGWCPHCYGTGLELPGFDEEQTGEESGWNARWEGEEQPCPACDGRLVALELLQRLDPAADADRLQHQGIFRAALTRGRAEQGEEVGVRIVLRPVGRRPLVAGAVLLLLDRLLVARRAKRSDPPSSAPRWPMPSTRSS